MRNQDGPLLAAKRDQCIGMTWIFQSCQSGWPFGREFGG